MSGRITLLLILLASACWARAGEGAQSPYVGEQARGIKALSEAEVSGLLAGRGLGLAKSAELNGYPGPAHVLELADQLGLRGEQLEATRALHARMLVQAQTLGRQLVDAEAGLEALFASGEVTASSLDEVLQRIGALGAQLRGVHLQAHVEQHALLSAAQIEAYARLRGYAGNEGHVEGRHH